MLLHHPRIPYKEENVPASLPFCPLMTFLCLLSECGTSHSVISLGLVSLSKIPLYLNKIYSPGNKNRGPPHGACALLRARARQQHLEKVKAVLRLLLHISAKRKQQVCFKCQNIKKLNLVQSACIKSISVFSDNILYIHIHIVSFQMTYNSYICCP